MRPVLNRLLDLQKIYGASAEGYWQAAFTGLALETHPQLGGDVEIDAADVRGQVENYINSLQRYLALTGMSAHTLAPQVSDPTNHIEKQIEAICIQLDIPKRVFMGSERGELASSQDDAQTNDQLKSRQLGYITPRIICPFVDRLIAVGVLSEPNYVEPVEPMIDEFGEEEQLYDEDGNPLNEFGIPEEEYDEDGNLLGDTAAEDDMGEEQYDDDGNLIKNRRMSGPILNAAGEQTGVRTKTGYCVEWPDLDSNTDKDKAQIAATLTQALAAYVSGNVEAVMPLMEFLTKIMGIPDDEAKALVKAAEAQQVEAEQKQVMQQPSQFGQPDMEQVGTQDQYGEEGALPVEEPGAEADFNDEQPPELQ
jgi:hypothetical protein